MIKKILFILMLMFLFPLVTLAEEVRIDCDKLEVKKGDEIVCQILADEMSFKTTSVVGKVILDDNLELVSSTYDNEKWKIFDSEFNVNNINLVSEDIITDISYPIATFSLKAVNTETVMSKISFEDVLIGDENYENHEIDVNDVEIYTEYEKVVNPNTGINSPYIILGSILVIALITSIAVKRKKYI